MLTGNIRSQIDAIWNAFLSGGISNPQAAQQKLVTQLTLIKQAKSAHAGGLVELSSLFASLQHFAFRVEL